MKVYAIVNDIEGGERKTIKGAVTTAIRRAIGDSHLARTTKPVKVEVIIDGIPHDSFEAANADEALRRVGSR